MAFPPEHLAVTLAPAIHDYYRAQAKREGWTMKHDVSFAELPETLQHANLAAARRIPSVLASVGLSIVAEGSSAPTLAPGEVLAILEDRIEIAAIAEHEGWMAEKTGEGWIYGPRRDDTAKIHPSIIPYAELSEEEREKDRSAVRNYPALLQKAGLKLQRSPAELTS